MKRVLGIAGIVGLVATTGWLWRENRGLRRELAAARDRAPEAGEGAEAPPTQEGASADAAPRRSGGNPMAMIGAVARAMDRPAAEAEAAPGAPPPPDWEARRSERQQRLRDVLGRRAGESDEAYRERVAPLVSGILAIPRDRLDEKRRQFEEAAGVSAEQRAAIDAAIKEGSDELLNLANQAVAAGDLTPYRRNSRGVLAFVGSTVGTLDTLDQRLRGVLTPEQWVTMEESGFDPLEYLGVRTPWESLTPPPPEPPRPPPPR
jgi:hypothetical protein